MVGLAFGFGWFVGLVLWRGLGHLVDGWVGESVVLVSGI